MDKERDKFLTEAMGEQYSLHPIDECGSIYNNFSTWEGFGKLWTWAKEQEWWYTFSTDVLEIINMFGCACEDYVEPNKFANAVYEYLKENKD